MPRRHRRRPNPSSRSLVDCAGAADHCKEGLVGLALGERCGLCFSRDGKFGWCYTGEVFDTATKKVVAQLTDANGGKGGPVLSSKFFEIHFLNGAVAWLGQQMGVGYVGTK